MIAAIDTPSLDWWAVAPELVLVITSLVVLLVGLVRAEWARRFVPIASGVAMLAAGGLAMMLFSAPRVDTFAGQIDADAPANVVRMLAALAGLATVIYSAWSRPADDRDAEHYSLLLAAVAGMGLFGAAGSLVTLFVGLELFSIALYVLCALEAERVESLESGLKYLILGGLSSAILLYGAALVYGATGTFDLELIGEFAERGILLHAGAALLLAALAFKASAAPLHWWTPDVYDGSPTSITAFMATATKVAAFVALARVLVVGFFPEADVWQPAVAVLAAASIVIGNLGAIVQQRLKRMLAYSSVAHAGYLLIGVVAWRELGITALLYALVAYVLMSLGAFALVLGRERAVGAAATYDDLAGSGWPGSPSGWTTALPGIAMVVLMLSLAGIPPTGGFFAKFGLFQAAIVADYTWLAVIGVLGSAVSLVYYLRVLVVMYMRPAVDMPPSVDAAAPAPRYHAFAVSGVVFAGLTLAVGIVPGHVFDAACDARKQLVETSDAPSACHGNTPAASAGP